MKTYRQIFHLKCWYAHILTITTQQERYFPNFFPSKCSLHNMKIFWKLTAFSVLVKVTGQGSAVQVTQSCPTLVTPWTIQSMEFSRLEYWSEPFPSPRGLSNPGIKPRSPALQAYSLSAKPQRKLKNTGVGSLFFLQRILLIQELNQSLMQADSLPTELSGKP